MACGHLVIYFEHIFFKFPLLIILEVFRVPFNWSLKCQVRLGKNGVEEVLGLGPLSDFEKEGLEKLIPELKASIQKGINFANQS